MQRVKVYKKRKGNGGVVKTSCFVWLSIMLAMIIATFIVQGV